MRVALCLHGRASGAASAERVDKEQSCKTEPHFNLSIAANMRLAHDGLWRYFILANRNAGHEVGVFLHSWSPDAAPLLDELYRPVASLHEPPQRLNKARSQHLSMQRCVTLVPERFPLVMVSRYDVVFVTPLLLGDLPGLESSLGDSSRPKLWLPQLCIPVPARSLSSILVQGVRGVCGCREGRCKRHREVGQGTIGQVPYTTRSTTDPRLHSALAGTPANYLSWVGDWWFVATRAGAASFGAIHHRTRQYQSVLSAMSGGQSACNASKAYFSYASKALPQAFPHWSHFYWSVHINHHFSPADVRFLPLLAGQDFLLGRRWWHAGICQISTTDARQAAHGSHAMTPHEGALLLNATSRRRPPSATWDLCPSAVSASAQGVGAAPERSPLALQCPLDLQEGKALLCSWDHPACARSERSRRLAQMLKLAKNLTRGIKLRCFSS
jgi:hypothetical protein